MPKMRINSVLFSGLFNLCNIYTCQQKFLMCLIANMKYQMHEALVEWCIELILCQRILRLLSAVFLLRIHCPPKKGIQFNSSTVLTRFSKHSNPKIFKKILKKSFSSWYYAFLTPLGCKLPNYFKRNLSLKIYLNIENTPFP